MRSPLLITACALALLAGATTAHAATPQERADDTAAWMQSVLRVPVPSRPTVVTRAMLTETSAAEADADGTIRLRPEFAGETPIALYARLHELSHVPANAACWGEPGSPERGVEEGIADALARDLFPAALHRLMPRWMWMGPLSTDYDARVGDVRYASAAATGKAWTSREARLWRRSLWSADCDGRRALLEEAGR